MLRPQDPQLKKRRSLIIFYDKRLKSLTDEKQKTGIPIANTSQHVKNKPNNLHFNNQ